MKSEIGRAHWPLTRRSPSVSKKKKKWLRKEVKRLVVECTNQACRILELSSHLGTALKDLEDARREIAQLIRDLQRVGEEKTAYLNLLEEARSVRAGWEAWEKAKNQ